MKNCLVMLTKTYPFGQGEEFIEDEVPILAKAFDCVIVIATSVAQGAGKTRAVPENVHVHCIRAAEVRHGLAASAFKLFPSRTFHGFVSPQEKEAIKGSPKSRAFLSYFVAKSERVFELCRQILLPYHLEAFDGVNTFANWVYAVDDTTTHLISKTNTTSYRATRP